MQKRVSEFYAKIIADSISPQGDRLTTIECRFPRPILSEINTHRMLSKSAQSSRAIPIAKRIDEVRDNPWVPEYWGKNQAGMVAEKELEGEERIAAIGTWIEAAQAAADYATILAQLKVHKQLSARILEPFLWQTNVMSSTDFGWENLLRLRDHPDAQPEFQILASHIREAFKESSPRYVPYGDMHLPYISDEERNIHDLFTLQRASVARVARTSYGNQGGFDLDKDLALEERLFEADPKHDAPYEMPACPWVDKDTPGNFKGWLQLRHSKDWQKARQELEATEASG